MAGKTKRKLKHSKHKAKSEGRSGTVRLILTGLVIIAQIDLAFIELLRLQKLWPWMSLATWAVSLITVLIVFSQRKNSGIKVPWIILILSLPVFGVFLYLITELSARISGMKKRYKNTLKKILPYAASSDDVIEKIKKENLTVGNMFGYIKNNSGYGAFTNTKVDFFPEAKDAFEQQKRDLMLAKKFIFLEYFAIEDTKSFHQVEEILLKKIKEGIKIRIIYDDIGSIGYISRRFYKRMIANGIECCLFNPVVPLWKAFLNHRDHRKIMIVDGEVGFTGGYNLADEYFGLKKPYGEWKDSAVRLEGEAVKNLMLIFLELWNSVKKPTFIDSDIEQFFTDRKFDFKNTGFVQPYPVNPLSRTHTGEDVYFNIINAAQKYVYITTPYLLLMDEMQKALILAAKRGVDVRIITPSIPDKKLVFKITHSNYGPLVKGGVRIFEYTPGFCHAKQVVCDDEIATCGTVNFDFRSFYHHFENGVLMYKTPAVMQIKNDFDELFKKSCEVTEKFKFHRNIFHRFADGIWRLLSPML